jgi:hypothetical protein
MRTLCVALAFVLVAGLCANSTAARQKPGKRARVQRVAKRATAESLMDLTLPGTPTPPQDPPPDSAALPSFVSVAAKEFSLTLSRPLVGAGSVRVELRNVGEDPHNLVVSPEGAHTPLASFSTVGPGVYERRTVDLAAGRYQLWCSLESHETLGMSVTLRVE